MVPLPDHYRARLDAARLPYESAPFLARKGGRGRRGLLVYKLWVQPWAAGAVMLSKAAENKGARGIQRAKEFADSLAPHQNELESVFRLGGISKLLIKAALICFSEERVTSELFVDRIGQIVRRDG
jgi:hypothetical protein